MKLRSMFELSVLAFAILLVCPADAWAYVDPGTGSYLFQILIAGGMAGVYTLRRYWDVLKTTLQGKREGSASSSTSPPNGMA